MEETDRKCYLIIEVEIQLKNCLTLNFPSNFTVWNHSVQHKNKIKNSIFYVINIILGNSLLK
jgi:hypothetical protein